MWRVAAQRRLRQRIFIDRQKVLRTVFQSPDIGPWIRELEFCARDSEMVLHNREESPGSMMALDEMPRLLSGILKRCPNITYLCLSNFIGPAEEEANAYDEEGGKELTSWHVSSRPHVIRQIGELKYLEHLWLCSTVSFALDSWNLCPVLRRLRSLKSLSLDHWNSRFPRRVQTSRWIIQAFR